MDEIKIYVLGKDKNNFSNFYYEHSNSLIIYEDGKFYFYSKIYSTKKQILFTTIETEFDSEFAEKMKEILKAASKEAYKISNENMDRNFIKMHKGIVSTINCYSYLDLSNISIFDFFKDIFIKLLMGHYLTNGNKRMALTFLKGIMWELGYYLKFTDGAWKDYTKYKTIIEEFATKLESWNSPEVITTTKMDIRNWIVKNAIIGLNWRQ